MAYIAEQKLEKTLTDAVNAAVRARAASATDFIAQQLSNACPIRNDHPALSNVPGHKDMMGNWLMFLPAEAVSAFRLEPNMADKATDKRTMWVGRLGAFRRILWLQYCAERPYSLDVPKDRADKLAARFADGGVGARVLAKMQACLRGAVVRTRAKPRFLTQLVGRSIRSIMVYVHGSGGMSWANPRLCRIAASAGCVVIAPDHMSTAEWRAKELKPLHTSADGTDYWNHNLFYGGKVDVEGEELWFSTSVEGVLAEPDKYKQIYEKVYQVRRAEVHYLLQRLPRVATAFGVVLMGTSEGAMTVHRFDDQRYGALVRGRIVNAFGGEYCYFTPTEASAQLGGSRDVPTLNLIGTADEYFGPTSADKFTYRKGYKKGADGRFGTPGGEWHGSKSYKIANGGATAYGDKQPTGNAYAAFVRQRLRKALVCTIVGAQHDATVTADNEVRDVMLSFLASPELCTDLYDQMVSTSPAYVASVRKVAEHREGDSEVVHIELSQPADVDPSAAYATYRQEAERWARKAAHKKAVAVS